MKDIKKKKPVDIDTGKRMLRLIGVLKLSQKEFSEKLKLSPSAVNQIIKGRGVSLSTLVSVCITFNVNAQWLLCGEGDIFINFAKSKRHLHN